MIFSKISVLPLEVQQEIFSWDPTFHLLYKRLWMDDIIIKKIDYHGLKSSCIWYSNGVHRKWCYSNFVSNGSYLFDEDEMRQRFWVLQSDDRYPSLQEPKEKIKWTSLHFFDTLQTRDQFIRNFGKSNHQRHTTFEELVDFYKERFCSTN